MSARRLPSVLAAAATAVAVAVCGPPAAGAATTTDTSTNWAGYVAGRTGVRFRHVSATWVQPAVSCQSGSPSYTSAWVGLGGNSESSQALEQIGTEADCTATGAARYSSWYELVPDVSHSARMTVKAGDQLHASVGVSGHRVTVSLANLTRGTHFTKTMRATSIDTSSAEWIVEAPSLCADASMASCRLGSLGDFGTTSFTGANATTTGGHTGTVSDAAWDATAIDLTAAEGRRPRFAEARARGAAGGEAVTGALDATGAAFSIAFQQSSTPAGGPGGVDGAGFAWRRMG
jgi:Peptidase A4 family